MFSPKLLGQQKQDRPKKFSQPAEIHPYFRTVFGVGVNTPYQKTSVSLGSEVSPKEKPIHHVSPGSLGQHVAFVGANLIV